MTAACWCGSTADILWHENQPLCLQHLPSVYPRATEGEKMQIQAATRNGGQMPDDWSQGEWVDQRKFRSGESFR